MTIDHEPYEGHTDKQIARVLIMDALNHVLEDDNRFVKTALEEIAEAYTPSKMLTVKKYLGKIALDIFNKYGQSKDLDFSGHPLVEKLNNLKLL